MLAAHRRAHRLIWPVLAVVLPAILLVAAFVRVQGPLEAPAVQLAAPVGGEGAR